MFVVYTEGPQQYNLLVSKDVSAGYCLLLKTIKLLQVLAQQMLGKTKSKKTKRIDFFTTQSTSTKHTP